jgi:hypothetical protein
MTLPESPKSKVQSPKPGGEELSHTHLCILFAAAGSGGQNPQNPLTRPI